QGRGRKDLTRPSQRGQTPPLVLTREVALGLTQRVRGREELWGAKPPERDEARASPVGCREQHVGIEEDAIHPRPTCALRTPTRTMMADGVGIETQLPDLAPGGLVVSREVRKLGLDPNAISH